jgi:hypothetical protein
MRNCGVMRLAVDHDVEDYCDQTATMLVRYLSTQFTNKGLPLLLHI